MQFIQLLKNIRAQKSSQKNLAQTISYNQNDSIELPSFNSPAQKKNIIKKDKNTQNDLYSINPESKSKTRNKSLTQRLNQTSNFQQSLLPTIKRKQKKGSYLETWLDEALNSNDNPNDTINSNAHPFQSTVDQPLKNIQSFQLDRLYLQSQNISKQFVDRLYNSLYIYTHGIDKVFQELISSLSLKVGYKSSNIQFDESGTDVRLLRNFWRGFTKLLQNCSSYQTAFMVVEKKHLKQIEDLKLALTNIEKDSQQRYIQYEHRIAKLQKQLQFQFSNLQKLKLDYKILQSTYELTDQTFNQEVALRLKFQQKINSVYTSYNQLKTKYQNIVVKLQMANHYNLDQKLREDQLNKTIEQLNIKFSGAQQMLSMEQRKVKDREQQIQIKIQQLEDIRLQSQIREEKDLKDSDIITQLIEKEKICKVKLEESLLRNKLSEKIIKQQNIQKEGIEKTVQRLRQKNDQLYEKIADYSRKISSLQQSLDNSNCKLQIYEVQLKKITIQKTQIQFNLQQKTNCVQSQQNQIQLLKKEVALLNTNLQKNNQIQIQFKSVKDKYERTNAILVRQKAQIQATRDGWIKQIQRLEESNAGLQLTLSARDNRIIQIQQNLVKQRQVNEIKLISANNILTKKQAMILTNTRITNEQKNQIQTKNYHIDNLNKEIQSLKNIIVKIKLELQILNNLNKSLKSQNEKTEITLSEISIKYTQVCKQVDKLKIDLESKNYTLNIKMKQNDNKVAGLVQLCNDYKEKIRQRGDFINPMLYEDIRMKIINYQLLNKQQREKNASISKLNQGKQEEIIKLNLLIQKQKNKQIQLTKQIERQIENSKKWEEKLKLQNNTKLYQKQVQKIANQLSNLKVSTNQQKQHLKSLLLNSQNEISKIKKQIQILTSKLQKQKQISLQFQKKAQTLTILMNIPKLDQQIQTTQVQIVRRVNSLSVSRSDYENFPKKATFQQKQTQYEIQEQSEEDKKQKKTYEKKVETKDFKKALKLTYMRR